MTTTAAERRARCGARWSSPRPPASRSARTRASAACCSTTTAPRSPRASTAAPARPHAEAAALHEAGEAARGRDRGRDPRALQPHRPHRPVRAGAARRRRTPRGVRPGRHQPGRRRRRRRRCATPASRSRAGCWPTRPGALNRAWTFAVDHGRPFVTWKFATTLDGRSAAADGTSRWVSSRAARLDTHRLRAECDAMLVGTGTVAVDDPELTVRDEVDEPLAAPAAARGDGAARPRPRPPGAQRPRRDGPPAHPRPAARRWPSCTPATASTSSSRAGRPWPPRSSAPGWSTRSSRTSRRCCSARVSAPSATSESARSPMRCGPTVTDVTVLRRPRRRAAQRPAHHDPRPTKET